jgi:hypothetical protein
MTTAPTVTQLLTDIARDRERIDALVASLTEEQLVAPTLQGGRSVKDEIAHVTAWERRLTTWLEAMARGKKPERPEPGYTFDDIDKLNERDFVASRDTSVAEVLAEAASMHGEALRAIGALSDEDLLDENTFGWPMWQMISSNTDEHYREHIDQIEAARKEAP